MIVSYGLTGQIYLLEENNLYGPVSNFAVYFDLTNQSDDNIKKIIKSILTDYDEFYYSKEAYELLSSIKSESNLCSSELESGIYWILTGIQNHAFRARHNLLIDKLIIEKNSLLIKIKIY